MHYVEMYILTGLIISVIYTITVIGEIYRFLRNAVEEYTYDAESKLRAWSGISIGLIIAFVVNAILWPVTLFLLVDETLSNIIHK